MSTASNTNISCAAVSNMNTSSVVTGQAENPLPESSDSVTPLPFLSNPSKLKDLSTTRLTDSNFRTWRNVTIAEFRYYGIIDVVNGKHSLPADDIHLQYWRNIEHLFDIKFANTVPSTQWELIKDKPSLREKWLAILAHYTRDSLTQLNKDLLNIKLEGKEKIEDFAVRLQELFANMERYGQSISPSSRVRWLLAKLEDIFPTETRALERFADDKDLTWDHVVKSYKEVEHTRPTAATTTGAALSVNQGPTRRTNHQFQRRQPYHNPRGNGQNNTQHNRDSFRGRGRGFGRGHGGRNHDQDRKKKRCTFEFSKVLPLL
jgi:gag-polypeptide of LTR copia-type